MLKACTYSVWKHAEPLYEASGKVAFVFAILLSSCTTNRSYFVANNAENETAKIQKIVLIVNSKNSFDSVQTQLRYKLKPAIENALQLNKLTYIWHENTNEIGAMNTLKNEINSINAIMINNRFRQDFLTAQFKIPTHTYKSQATISPVFAEWQSLHSTPFFAIIDIATFESRPFFLKRKNATISITVANVATSEIIFHEQKQVYGLLNAQQLTSLFYESFHTLKYATLVE